jgi:kinesin light chain
VLRDVWFFFENEVMSDVVPLSTVLCCCRKKIECIGKMTQMTQEEIMTNTKTVVQGLEALKNEHNSILNGLTSSLELAVSAVEKAQQAVQQQSVNSTGVTSGGVGDASVVEEKTGLVQKSLEMIELGLGEAQVRTVVL